MSNLQHLRQGVSDAWESILGGWQRLYARASGAITRFSPGSWSAEGVERDEHELETRSIGWGVMAAEVFDDSDRLVVRLEAPGMDRDSFDIQVIDDHLVIRGEKGVQQERSRGRYHIAECAYGRFERAIPLPGPVDTEGARATYEHGVLRVEMPRLSSAHGQRAINVEAG
ncbi:Hsp20/alpha crystallin family protein [Ectothiorhodospira sp. BSL-9]|uniref:Hsp20/alpha crystallin family protein n=1 Tax=Ectothiorhodospira sp. BSL-9 TaxID=1442136 RepID=UPI0007B43CE3|nr:Hsp20/alpha crystallin family protein [Ectothiorhodospira sp. BSL-9]ANB01293.1 heat-shock protein Hsp20 [Ectothiorhodospira sp. BSL-9]TVQ74527.1 MAG: Hsp20/alpha crystallin family protein [Chromatiaceae bacterium]